jgi:hypothetical protein
VFNQQRGHQKGPAPQAGCANYTTMEEIPMGEDVLAGTFFLNEHVSWEPHATGYDPKNLDTGWFPPAANDWENKCPVPDMIPPLLAEEEGPPT